MNAARVATTVEAGGELHLTELPCRRGDKVEAIVLIQSSRLAGLGRGAGQGARRGR